MIETVLEFNGLPENIASISFLDSNRYTSNSVNNLYRKYPHLLKIVKEGKSGIYSYTVDEATYPIKEKTKIKEIPNYDTTIINGDTIFVPIDVAPIEPFSFVIKGSSMLKQVLPIIYTEIQQNPADGLIYVHKDNKIGIYPNHMHTDFEVFKQKTTSFYEITKNGKQGWLDIKTFKEYY